MQRGCRFVTAINQDTSLKEIFYWVKKGIKEFYFGYMPDAWVNKYGWEVCTNRRPYPQRPHVTDLGTAKQIIQYVHGLGAKIYLAVNEHVYPAELAEEVLEFIEEFSAIGIDAVMLADVALLSQIRARGIDVAVHGSVGIGVYNSETVASFQRLGVRRFVLPRKLRVDEMVGIIEETELSAVEFEIFLLGEWCFYNDEYCFCPHGYAQAEFCRSKVAAAEPAQARHALLAESYHYSWCGLCLPVVLRKYLPRLVFKIPVRSDVFNSKLVIEEVLRAYRGSGSTVRGLRAAMKCQGRYCAYEISR